MTKRVRTLAFLLPYLLLGSSGFAQTSGILNGQSGSVAKSLWRPCTAGQTLVKDTSQPYGVACADGGGGGVDLSGTSDTQILFNNAGAIDGSANLTWDSANLTVATVPNVTGLMVTSQPSGGATAYEYYIVANLPNGFTTGTFAGNESGTDWIAFEDGPATLDATHYNDLSWTAVPGAVNYSVYTDQRDGTPSTLGLLGTVTGTTFRDDGDAGDDNPLYPDNTTGRLAVASINKNLTPSVDDIIQVGSRLQTDVSGTADNDYLQLFRYTDVRASAHSVGAGLYGIVSYLNGNTTYQNKNTSSFYGSTWIKAGGATKAAVYWGAPVFEGATTLGTIFYADTSIIDAAGPSGAATAVSYWSDELGGKATNAYGLWLDEQGVFRIKADNTFDSVYQAIPALYNPQVTKYVPGAADYERIVEQWNGNVAEIGPEKGGTGTERELKLIGSALRVKSITACPMGQTAPIVVNDTGTLVKGSCS